MRRPKTKTGLMQPARWTPNTQSSQWAGLRCWYPFDGFGHPGAEDQFNPSSAFGRALSAGNEQFGYYPQGDGQDLSHGLHTNGAYGSLYTSPPAYRSVPITFSVWLARAVSGSHNVICWVGHHGGWDGFYFSLTDAASSFVHVEGVLFKAANGPAGDVGRFNHYVGVVESLSNRKFYVNGVLAGTNTEALSTENSKTVFILNSDWNGTNTSNVAIRDYRVYDRPLTGNEIWNLYDPATRYDLYNPLRRTTWFIPPPPGTQELAPPLIASAVVMYAPAVEPGTATINAPLIASAVVMYAPTVIPEGAAVAPPRIESATVLYAPTVTDLGITLQAPLIVSTSLLYAPMVTPEGATITVPLISTVSVMYAPSVAFQLGGAGRRINIGAQNRTTTVPVDPDIEVC